ncbi:MAG: hypothetical protein GDA50_01965 [Alphaproteobacteria bacterium GM202ARS2]|nr:hypothetical protein [Alphaproteobacteria bacterium GM202ARS2]
MPVISQLPSSYDAVTAAHQDLRILKGSASQQLGHMQATVQGRGHGQGGRRVFHMVDPNMTPPSDRPPGDHDETRRDIYQNFKNVMEQNFQTCIQDYKEQLDHSMMDVAEYNARSTQFNQAMRQAHIDILQQLKDNLNITPAGAGQFEIPDTPLHGDAFVKTRRDYYMSMHNAVSQFIALADDIKSLHPAFIEQRKPKWHDGNIDQRKPQPKPRSPRNPRSPGAPSRLSKFTIQHIRTDGQAAPASQSPSKPTPKPRRQKATQEASQPKESWWKSLPDPYHRAKMYEIEKAFKNQLAEDNPQPPRKLNVTIPQPQLDSSSDDEA